jgi:hypothetical protein
LMTLCIYCNQRKREFTKKVDPDYDWENSPWAYPEKFQQKKIAEDIKRYATAHQKTVNQVIEEITSLIEKKD